MRGIVHGVTTLTAVLLVVAPLAGAQQGAVAVGKQGDVELREAAQIGTTTLQPGHYRVRHELSEGRHYLIITPRVTVHSTEGYHYPGGLGEEIARVPCVILPLDRDVRRSEIHVRRDATGTSRITQIRVPGEKGGHLIALAP